MKKLAILFIALTASLTSCNNDDDATTTAELQGKWIYSQEGSILNGQEVLTNYDHETGCPKDFVMISATTFVDHEFEGADCLESTDTKTYTRNGNTITVTQDGMTYTGEITQLTNSTLKITREISGIEGQALKLITIFTKG